MNYKGRILGFFIGLCQAIAWGTEHYISKEEISVFGLIPLIGYSLLGWWFGKQYDKAKFFSEKDALTKIYNRRFINKVFPKLKSLMERRNKKLAVFIIDINNFKKINDTYGHKAGDKVLTDISKLLLENTRNTDFVARWGGDEFLIVSPDIGDNGTAKVINRIEIKLEELPITKEWNFGISIGEAIYPDEAKDLEELIHTADKKMYQIKFAK